MQEPNSSILTQSCARLSLLKSVDSRRYDAAEGGTENIWWGLAFQGILSRYSIGISFIYNLCFKKIYQTYLSAEVQKCIFLPCVQVGFSGTCFWVNALGFALHICTKVQSISIYRWNLQVCQHTQVPKAALYEPLVLEESPTDPMTFWEAAPECVACL